MNNFSSSETSNDREEYPEVTQADLDRAKFRIALKPMPRKQSITISLYDCPFSTHKPDRLFLYQPAITSHHPQTRSPKSPHQPAISYSC